MKKLTSMFSTAGAFVASTVMSSAAFAQGLDDAFFTSMKHTDEFKALKEAAVSIVVALAGVALVLLIGRAVLRALQIRP